MFGGCTRAVSGAGLAVCRYIRKFLADPLRPVDGPMSNPSKRFQALIDARLVAHSVHARYRRDPRPQ